MACYAIDGTIAYEYNLFEIVRTHIRATAPLPVGKVTIEVETARAGTPRPAGPLDVTIRANGVVVAHGQVPVSAPLAFTANGCLNIGTNLGSPVSVDYYDRAPFAFNGEIEEMRVRYT